AATATMVSTRVSVVASRPAREQRQANGLVEDQRRAPRRLAGLLRADDDGAAVDERAVESQPVNNRAGHDALVLAAAVQFPTGHAGRRATVDAGRYRAVRLGPIGEQRAERGKVIARD